MLQLYSTKKFSYASSNKNHTQNKKKKPAKTNKQTNEKQSELTHYK